jgi:hypothetical protein
MNTVRTWLGQRQSYASPRTVEAAAVPNEQLFAALPNEQLFKSTSLSHSEEEHTTHNSVL